jgi:hypothetical protein
MWIASPELSKPLGSLTRDQGFQSQTDKVRFFLYTRQLSRPLHELIVYVQGRSHMH